MEKPMSGYAHPEVLADTEWLAAHLHDLNVRIVECDGSRRLYDSGHIEGAVFWNAYGDILRPDLRVEDNPEQAAELFRRSGIGRDTTVVIYSNSASAGALAFWYLKLFGHAAVKLLDGGRPKWEAEGRPLTSETPAIEPTSDVPSAPDPDI